MKQRNGKGGDVVADIRGRLVRGSVSTRYGFGGCGGPDGQLKPDRMVIMVLTVSLIGTYLLSVGVRMRSRDSLYRNLQTEEEKYAQLVQTLRYEFDGGNATQGQRFLLYDSRYGQLNNQLMGLINALTIGKHLNATVVVPNVDYGFESFANRGEKASGDYSLVGDYFDFKELQKVQSIVHVDQFLVSKAAGRLAQEKRTVTPTNFWRGETECMPFRYLKVRRDSQEREKQKVKDKLKSITKKKGPGFSNTLCDEFRVVSELAEEDRSRKKSDVYVLGGLYYHGLEMNCTVQVPHWYNVRRNLIPRGEYRRTVSDFLRTVRRPILVLHLRFLNSNDRIDGPGMYNLLVDTVPAETLQTIRTIYVAYSSREAKLLEEGLVLEYLNTSLPHVEVITAANMPNNIVPGSKTMEMTGLTPWALELQNDDEGAFNNIFMSNYGSAMLDLWLAVKADVFVGRTTSSFSRNIQFWREIFAKDVEDRHYYMYNANYFQMVVAAK